jgi:hypothetical protein
MRFQHPQNIKFNKSLFYIKKLFHVGFTIFTSNIAASPIKIKDMTTFKIGIFLFLIQQLNIDTDFDPNIDPRDVNCQAHWQTERRNFVGCRELHNML